MSSHAGFCRALGLGLVLVIAVAGFAKAAAPGTSALIKSRQDKLRDMGAALKGIDDELKKRSQDWDTIILPDADTLQSRSSFLLNWFPKGSGPESGLKTYALPAVWQKPDDFTKLGKAMQAEAAKLKQIVATRDPAAVKAQVIAVGKSCKACHDNYRSPDFEKDNNN